MQESLDQIPNVDEEVEICRYKEEKSVPEARGKRSRNASV